MRYTKLCSGYDVRLLAILALLLALFVPRVQAAAGDAEPGFDPNVGAAVLCTAVQPDGKILIGGVFSLVDGMNRNHLARLNADGSLDPNFSPNVNDEVFAIAVQPDGKILIGGRFTQVGGVQRLNIARLNADGTLENSLTIGTD